MRPSPRFSCELERLTANEDAPRVAPELGDLHAVDRFEEGSRAEWWAEGLGAPARPGIPMRPRLVVSPHAVDRFVERAAPQMTPAEALKYLVSALPKAERLTQRGSSGEQLWRLLGDSATVVVRINARRGEAVAVTVIPPPGMGVHAGSAAEAAWERVVNAATSGAERSAIALEKRRARQAPKKEADRLARIEAHGRARERFLARKGA